MATTSKKMMITDVFVNGAFQGWNIATHSTIPNVLIPNSREIARDYF